MGRGPVANPSLRQGIHHVATLVGKSINRVIAMAMAMSLLCSTKLIGMTVRVSTMAVTVVVE